MSELKVLEKDVNYVKIHGLQRSGTNYASFLLNNNFKDTEALVNIGGWKHGPYCLRELTGDQELNVLAVIKNPFAWLLSVYAYWKKSKVGPNLENVDFETFVKSRATFEFQTTVPYLLRASNPVQYWNNMNYHWSSIRLRSKSVLVVTYESLLSHRETTLDAIASKFKLTKKLKKYKSTTNTFAPTGETPEPSDDKFSKKTYYLKQHYMKEYSDDLIAFIDSQLDEDLMHIFGYWKREEDGQEENPHQENGHIRTNRLRK